VLVLGTTEQQVRVLTELDPEEVAEVADTPGTGVVVPSPAPASGGSHRADLPAPTRAGAAAARTAGRASEGALAGSVLSPDTWRQALAAATRRAS
jgi:flagellar protein FliO/FliZ